MVEGGEYGAWYWSWHWPYFCHPVEWPAMVYYGRASDACVSECDVVCGQSCKYRKSSAREDYSEEYKGFSGWHLLSEMSYEVGQL